MKILLLLFLFTFQAMAGTVNEYNNGATPTFLKVNGNRFPLPLTSGLDSSDNVTPIRVSAGGALLTSSASLTNVFAEKTALTGAAQTFTAPAGAIGGKIQALSDNTTNVRYKQGAAATTTSGIRLEPGRSEDFLGGTDISVIVESGTCAVSVEWTVSN